MDTVSRSRLFFNKSFSSSINYAAALIENSDMEGAVRAYAKALQYNTVGLVWIFI